MYLFESGDVHTDKSLLQRRNRLFHVLLDGWTSPIHTANIGIILVWEDGGEMYDSLLELVKCV